MASSLIKAFFQIPVVVGNFSPKDYIEITKAPMGVLD